VKVRRGEHSARGTVYVRERAINWRSSRQEFLRDLEESRLTQLFIASYRRGVEGKYVPKGTPEYEKQRTALIGEVEREIDHLDRTIAFYDKRIAGWELRELPKEGEPIKDYEMP
jgi:hypothetical protein